jgi:endonuclease/exonuclease/phosphatase family metal-dependent hydrolase
MAHSLKILCWNIAEGMFGLDPVVAHIRQKDPDIVLLNEVRQRRWPFGTDQVKELAAKTGLPHYSFGKTVATGLTGHKGVAVLSKYHLGPSRMHTVLRGQRKTAFSTLITSAMINGVRHELLSTRFAPHNSADHAMENRMGVVQAAELARTLSPDLPLIFGGDFNARLHTDQMKLFNSTSGLKDAHEECPDPTPGACWDPSDRIDFIFYRGKYKVRTLEFRCPEPQGSDHPSVFAILESTQDEFRPA